MRKLAGTDFNAALIKIKSDVLTFYVYIKL